jgi:hypothetical protein
MSIVPGKPSVFFLRQFVHICGMICMHQQLQSQTSVSYFFSFRFRRFPVWGGYIHFTQVSIESFSHEQFRKYSPVPRVWKSKKIVCQYHDSSSRAWVERKKTYTKDIRSLAFGSQYKVKRFAVWVGVLTGGMSTCGLSMALVV